MEKIKKLRNSFQKEQIEGYIIPKNDEFFGEYIPNYNDRLNFISNFSGSTGLSLILKKNNYLFVDGRYTLQASKECGKFFKIITYPKKMPYDILKNKKISIGFDPKLFTKKTLDTFFDRSSCELKPIKNNLIDKIWRRKFKKSKSKFYSLPSHSVGKTFKTKVDKIISNLKKKNADFQLITSSENNAWLFNIRGEDSKYSPIPYSHSLISKKGAVIFFCDLNKLSKKLKKNFSKVKFFEIKLIEKFISNIEKKNL